MTPGFWNMHVHLTTLLPHNHALDNASVGAKVIRAGVNAMEGLRHGFTGLRSVGEEHNIDVVWQQAFDEGVRARSPHLRERRVGRPDSRPQG